MMSEINAPACMEAKFKKLEENAEINPESKAQLKQLFDEMMDINKANAEKTYKMATKAVSVSTEEIEDTSKSEKSTPVTKDLQNFDLAKFEENLDKFTNQKFPLDELEGFPTQDDLKQTLNEYISQWKTKPSKKMDMANWDSVPANVPANPPPQISMDVNKILKNFPNKQEQLELVKVMTANSKISQDQQIQLLKALSAKDPKFNNKILSALDKNTVKQARKAFDKLNKDYGFKKNHLEDLKKMNEAQFDKLVGQNQTQKLMTGTSGKISSQALEHMRKENEKMNEAIDRMKNNTNFPTPRKRKTETNVPTPVINETEDQNLQKMPQFNQATQPPEFTPVQNEQIQRGEIHQPASNTQPLISSQSQANIIVDQMEVPFPYAASHNSQQIRKRLQEKVAQKQLIQGASVDDNDSQVSESTNGTVNTPLPQQGMSVDELLNFIQGPEETNKGKKKKKPKKKKGNKDKKEETIDKQKEEHEKTVEEDSMGDSKKNVEPSELAVSMSSGEKPESKGDKKELKNEKIVKTDTDELENVFNPKSDADEISDEELDSFKK